MTVQVIFTRSHAVGSILLRAALWSPWSHCAIIDGDEVIEAAAFGGVRVRPLADMLADATKHAIIELPGNAEAVIAAARSQIGKPYDWAGVLGFGFRRRWQDDDAWFCSELVAWAFAEAGTPLFRVEAHRITPQDLFKPIWRLPCIRTWS